MDKQFDKPGPDHPSGEYACNGKKGYFTAYHVGHQWVCTDENCSWRKAQNPRGENDVDARPALERGRLTQSETGNTWKPAGVPPTDALKDKGDPSSTAPNFVWAVENKTSFALFASEEAARSYVAGFAASVSGGMSIAKLTVLGAPSAKIAFDGVMSERELAEALSALSASAVVPTEQFTDAHNALNLVDMLLCEAGYAHDSSLRHNLSIAKSMFSEAERRLSPSAVRTSERMIPHRVAPVCDEHGEKGGGARSGCPYCVMVALYAALSKIDYLCGEPNDMEMSGFDVHCNEQAVVEHVRSRLTKSAIPTSTLDQYKAFARRLRDGEMFEEPLSWPTISEQVHMAADTIDALIKLVGRS